MVLGLLVTMVGTASPAAAAAGGCWDTTFRGVGIHACYPEQWLTAGGNWYFGNARMTMQSDGNLVIYDQRNGKAKWFTGTNGTSANRMDFSGEGNTGVLIVRDDRTGQVYWNAPRTAVCAGNTQGVIALQADSNFVWYCYGSGTFSSVIWASNTVF
jgi:hypothetical protein